MMASQINATHSSAQKHAIGDSGGNSNQNIYLTFEEVAQKQPSKTAVVIPIIHHQREVQSYQYYSFDDLLLSIRKYANGFLSAGLKPDMKALVFIKPGLELISIAFALAKIGIVPVLIDAGIGMRNVLDCVRQAKPDIFIGIPKAFVLKICNHQAFDSVKFNFIDAGHCIFPSYISLQKIKDGDDSEGYTHPRDAEDLTFLLFTSGSTGAPKGVVYTPSIFQGQLATLRSTFSLTPDDVDMPIIPSLVIGTLCLGMKVVIPPINPLKPTSMDPKVIAKVVNDCGVTFSFGSPAVWGKIARFSVDHAINFPKMKQLLVAGAPSSATTLRLFRKIVPNGRFHTPLGATECTPITTISSDELDEAILSRQESGGGFCVGRPTRNHTIRMIGITDDDVPMISEAKVLSEGDIGEIIVKGPVVTKLYYENKLATRKAKIYESNGEVWHRTGDVGYFDDQGRIWFCGRKAHMCNSGDETYYSVKVEYCFSGLAGINRVALVNISLHGQKVLALCIEPTQRFMSPTARRTIVTDIVQVARCYRIPLRVIAFHARQFPVDKRHHAKIERHLLAKWVQDSLTRLRCNWAIYHVSMTNIAAR